MLKAGGVLAGTACAAAVANATAFTALTTAAAAASAVGTGLCGIGSALASVASATAAASVYVSLSPDQKDTLKRNSINILTDLQRIACIQACLLPGLKLETKGSHRICFTLSALYRRRPVL